MIIQSIKDIPKTKLTSKGDFVYTHKEYRFVHLELIEVFMIDRSDFYYVMHSVDSKEYKEIYTL